MIEMINARLKQLHAVAPQSIGDLMGLEPLEYDAERKECLMRCKTDSWMRNGHGTLHGGMGAAIADQAMGLLAYIMKQGEGIAPAIELQLNYHRPLIPGEDVLLRVRTVSVTRTLIHMAAELYRASQPEKLCISSHATYFYVPAK